MSFETMQEYRNSNKYDAGQLMQIEYGFENEIDLSLYDDPKYDARQMSVLANALVEGLDISGIADYRIDASYMEEILKDIRKAQQTPVKNTDIISFLNELTNIDGAYAYLHQAISEFDYHNQANNLNITNAEQLHAAFAINEVKYEVLLALKNGVNATFKQNENIVSREEFIKSLKEHSNTAKIFILNQANKLLQNNLSILMQNGISEISMYAEARHTLENELKDEIDNEISRIINKEKYPRNVEELFKEALYNSIDLESITANTMSAKQIATIYADTRKTLSLDSSILADTIKNEKDIKHIMEDKEIEENEYYNTMAEQVEQTEKENDIIPEYINEPVDKKQVELTGSQKRTYENILKNTNKDVSLIQDARLNPTTMQKLARLIEENYDLSKLLNSTLNSRDLMLATELMEHLHTNQLENLNNYNLGKIAKFLDPKFLSAELLTEVIRLPHAQFKNQDKGMLIGLSPIAVQKEITGIAIKKNPFFYRYFDESIKADPYFAFRVVQKFADKVQRGEQMTDAMQKKRDALFLEIGKKQENSLYFFKLIASLEKKGIQFDLGFDTKEKIIELSKLEREQQKEKIEKEPVQPVQENKEKEETKGESQKEIEEFEKESANTIYEQEKMRNNQRTEIDFETYKRSQSLIQRAISLVTRVVYSAVAFIHNLVSNDKLPNYDIREALVFKQMMEEKTKNQLEVELKKDTIISDKTMSYADRIVELCKLACKENQTLIIEAKDGFINITPNGNKANVYRGFAIVNDGKVEIQKDFMGSYRLDRGIISRSEKAEREQQKDISDYINENLSENKKNIEKEEDREEREESSQAKEIEETKSKEIDEALNDLLQKCVDNEGIPLIVKNENADRFIAFYIDGEDIYANTIYIERNERTNSKLYNEAISIEEVNQLLVENTMEIVPNNSEEYQVYAQEFGFEISAFEVLKEEKEQDNIEKEKLLYEVGSELIEDNARENNLLDLDRMDNYDENKYDMYEDWYQCDCGCEER